MIPGLDPTMMRRHADALSLASMLLCDIPYDVPTDADLPDYDKIASISDSIIELELKLGDESYDADNGGIRGRDMAIRASAMLNDIRAMLQRPADMLEHIDEYVRAIEEAVDDAIDNITTALSELDKLMKKSGWAPVDPEEANHD